MYKSYQIRPVSSSRVNSTSRQIQSKNLHQPWVFIPTEPCPPWCRCLRFLPLERSPSSRSRFCLKFWLAFPRPEQVCKSHQMSSGNMQKNIQNWLKRPNKLKDHCFWYYMYNFVRVVTCFAIGVMTLGQSPKPPLMQNAIDSPGSGPELVHLHFVHTRWCPIVS